MSGSNIIADTNILLYMFSGDERAAKALLNKQIFVSFISEMELLSSKDLSIHAQNQIEKFLSQCSIVELNSEIKKLAINYRKQTRLKLPDSIIAATAHYLNAPIITADIGFKKIGDIDLILYTP